MNQEPVNLCAGAQFNRFLVVSCWIFQFSQMDSPTDMWNLDDAEKSEPDFDQLKETDLNELRTMIRDYELHNSALFNLARELRIELLRVQEQKHHLKSTLKCMKKV